MVPTEDAKITFGMLYSVDVPAAIALVLLAMLPPVDLRTGCYPQDFAAQGLRAGEALGSKRAFEYVPSPRSPAIRIHPAAGRDAGRDSHQRKGFGTLRSYMQERRLSRE